MRLQDTICDGVEQQDDHAKFKEERWEREGGGGGRTRIISEGSTWEKGGVNTSAVFGEVTEPMRRQLGIDADSWFAAGISLVLHPLNPMVPTVHANYRMFELYEADGSLKDRWFGGGTDLTPYYLSGQDAVHFHSVYADICSRYDAGLYRKFKLQCDEYFVNTHRDNERRGIGGIFYDHERANERMDESSWLSLASDCGLGFLEAYLPIVKKRKDQAYTADNRYWQEIRRGRYTEFNLVHDRGTLFGLRTNGRTESILMSLPPTVRFVYDYQPAPGSEEEKLLNACRYPQDWVAEK